MNNITALEIFMNGKRVGRLAQAQNSLCAFEYDAEFLRGGNAISPFLMPLETRLFIAERDPFDGNFGVFDDSLPDGWGSLLLDRYLREQGEDPDKLTMLQRLSLIGSNGRGALEYKPDNSAFEDPEFLDFDKLAHDAEKLLSSKRVVGKSLDSLFRYGGSSGGARPKVFAKIDGKEWLVKFKATNDPLNIGKTEYKHALLAKECGIQMPEVRLFENKYFGVERFDRTPNDKIHTISASGLLNAFYRMPSLDYIDLLKACKALTRDMQQVSALFRQMVFNVAISNRDDHSKNFAFQFRDNRWKLSPAYDLLPSAGFNGYHTTTVNNKGEPRIEDIMTAAKEVDLNKRSAKKICEQIIDTCTTKKMLKIKL